MILQIDTVEQVWDWLFVAKSLKRIRFPILITSAILLAGFFVGYKLADVFVLPAEIFQVNAFDKDWLEIVITADIPLAARCLDAGAEVELK